MKYFNFDVGGPEVHLYPIVCWHIGAKQSSQLLIDKVLKRIDEDPLARWIYLGDAGECVTKTSKGNIYEQTMNPGDQLRVAAELLAPRRAKGLFGIRGNHGNRIDRDSGIGWDEMLCTRIGIPYMGVACFANIGLVLGRSGDKRLPVSLYCHHGSASAIGPAGKMSAGHKAEAFIIADVILTAHTHACGECWPSHYYAYLDNRMREVRWGRTNSFVCGSAYDSRSGYAEEKMYPPLLPEHLMLKLRVRRTEHQKRERLVLDVAHEKIMLGVEEVASGRID